VIRAGGLSEWYWAPKNHEGSKIQLSLMTVHTIITIMAPLDRWCCFWVCFWSVKMAVGWCFYWVATTGFDLMRSWMGCSGFVGVCFWGFFTTFEAALLRSTHQAGIAVHVVNQVAEVVVLCG
jgi:hypothetical protein